VKHNYSMGPYTARNVTKRKKYVDLESLEQGDHFKTSGGMIGVFLGANASYATVLFYAVPKFTNCTEEFAEDLAKFYLGKKQIAGGTQVTYQKGAYDVKEANPNIRVQPEEHDGE